MLIHRSNAAESESEPELELAVLDVQPSGKPLPHGCSGFWPRGFVPARRATCALNCQGVVMPWRGHLETSPLVLLSDQMQHSSQEWAANVRRLSVMDSRLSDF